MARQIVAGHGSAFNDVTLARALWIRTAWVSLPLRPEFRVAATRDVARNAPYPVVGLYRIERVLPKSRPDATGIAETREALAAPIRASLAVYYRRNFSILRPFPHPTSQPHALRDSLDSLLKTPRAPADM